MRPHDVYKTWISVLADSFPLPSNDWNIFSWTSSLYSYIYMKDYIELYEGNLFKFLGGKTT